MKMCHVYVIRCAETDFIKIGISSDPSRRVEDLQVGSPYPLQLAFCSMPMRRSDAIRVEQMAHYIFEMVAVGREWFHLPTDFAPFALNVILQVYAKPQRARDAAAERLHDFIENYAIEESRA